MEAKNRILLVSSAFLPEISPRSFRAIELTKEFCREGHDVTVITKFRDYNYSDFLNSFPVKIKMWKKSVLPTIPRFKIKLVSLFFHIVSRGMMFLFEYPVIEEMIRVRKMLQNEKDFDLMISFAVPFPVHWGVAWAQSTIKRNAKTWIADCGDPYMFARLDRFRKPFYFKQFEMFFCQRCDYISVPFVEMRKQFYPQFEPKIKVIPQGFNFEEVYLCNERPNSTSIHFMFAGSIIPGKRDLGLFLNFLNSLKYDFVFRIYTNQKRLFLEYMHTLGRKLEIFDYIDRLSLIYEMSKCDFLVNVDTSLDDQGNVEAVPSKLIDYALSGRPILNINSSKLDEDKVIAFLNKDYSRQRRIDLSKHDIRKVSAQFLELRTESPSSL